MGKRRTVIFLALLIAVCGIAYFLVASREPVYQGKNLTAWLDQYRTNEWTNNHDLEQQAETAVRHFGTNQIPRYLKMLFHRPSALQLKLAALSPVWRKRFHIPSTNDYDWQLDTIRYRGAYGLAALGPDAKPALPSLIARLNDKQEDGRLRYFAIFTIGRLGPVAQDTLPSVINCLNDRDFSIHSYAIHTLGYIHEDAEHVIPLLVDIIDKNFVSRQNEMVLVYSAIPAIAKFRGEAASAVPVIVRCLDHWEIGTREAAILALGDIHAHPELAVPALIEHLKTTQTKTEDERRMIYTYTFIALDRFGPEARSAVPTLLQSINDDDPDIRANARGALKHIDPAAAAKAGLK